MAQHSPGHPGKAQVLSADDVRKLIEEADRQRADEVKRREEEYRLLVERQKQDGRRNRTAWLLIRYAAADLGIRPIPPGDVFWDSPDIWIESSDPFGNPVAGETNFVHARVFNLGAFMASPVKIDFYWGNPALGLGPSTMNFIGSEYVEIPSLTSVDVRCNTPWVPVVVNDGHECVMVNTSCWVIDPIMQAFQPTLDRHVGQRNLHVIERAPGQSVKLSVSVNNVFPIAMPVSIESHVSRLRFRDPQTEIAPEMLGALAGTFAQHERFSASRLVGAFHRGSPAHKSAQAALAVERRSAAASPRLFDHVAEHDTAAVVTSRLSDERGVIGHDGSGRYAGQLLGGLDVFRDRAVFERPRGFVLEEFILDAHAFRIVDTEVTVPADAQPGEFLVVQLSHEAGPLTAGGYTLVIIVR